MDPTIAPIIEKVVGDSILGAILLIIVWRLPTLISLFMENRKEVSAIMDKQSSNFTESLKDILDKHEKLTNTLIERFEGRFKNIESTLSDVCGVMTKNQKTIEGLLEAYNGPKRDAHS